MPVALLGSPVIPPTTPESWHAVPDGTDVISLVRGKLLFQFTRQSSNRSIAAQFDDFRVRVALFDSHLSADQPLQLQHLRDFFLGQQIDLEVQMIAVVSPLAHAIVLDQHEGREQYALKRGEHAE